MLNNCGPSGNPPNAATMVGVLQGPNMMLGDDRCPLCHKKHGDSGKLEETKETKDAVDKLKRALQMTRELSVRMHTPERKSAIDANERIGD
jgi:hypothetical protein